MITAGSELTGQPVDPTFRPVPPVRSDHGLSIRVGRNVWIGASAVVLQGVTIGDDSVVGAGSVVTHDVPAGVLVVGSPARVVRALDGSESA